MTVERKSDDLMDTSSLVPASFAATPIQENTIIRSKLDRNSRRKIYSFILRRHLRRHQHCRSQGQPEGGVGHSFHLDEELLRIRPCAEARLLCRCQFPKSNSHIFSAI